jgi:hypothetical protein
MTKTDHISKNSFDQNFCAFLEHHLCQTFQNSADKNIRGLWCDGIIHEPLTKSKKSVNDSRQLQTTAFIGKDGQGKYEMTIRFGNDALSKYARGLDLTPCVPSDENMNWVNIDTDKKTIELQLK